MRILHIVPYYAPALTFGGVVSAVSGLATAQSQRGHQVTVLTTDAYTTSTRYTIRDEMRDGVRVMRCRNLIYPLRVRYNLSTPIGFRSTFQKLIGEIDIVHAHELRTIENLLIDHLKPIVLSPHGTISLQTGRGGFKRLWDSLLGRFILRRVDQVAALTAIEAQEAQELWASLKVLFPGATIIPNGVSADFLSSFEGVGTLRERYALGNGVVVLFLGRLHERKGLQFLIPAFAQASRDFPDARLLIVGPDEGMLSHAQALVQQHDLADRVRFTGLLEGANQRAALATADIFVLPAVGEGLSMAALEAMAIGLPLILTPGCNLPDLETRGAGLLVPREVESIASALQTLLGNPDRRSAMGKIGQAWVGESFTWPAIAIHTENLYDQLLKTR